MVQVSISFRSPNWDDTYTMRSPSGTVKVVRPEGFWPDGDAPEELRLTRDEAAVLQKIKDTYIKNWEDHNPQYFLECFMEASYHEMAHFANAASKTNRRRKETYYEK